MGDVARLAGVSVQTVSRVATGSDHVRPETRAKVLRAMNKLGYSPNRAAQALRRGSFKTIGVLTQQIQRTGEALTTAGVLEAATAADYAVNLVQVERAVSDDLDHWEVLPPLTGPSAFGQLEVCQSRMIDGRHVLVFSRGSDMQAEPGPGGVWIAEGAGALGPWDIDRARHVRPEHLYAGQVLRLRDGEWVFSGFNNIVDGRFVGSIPDPIPWGEIRLVGES